MEQRTIRLNFDLSFVYGPRTFRVPLAAVMMLAAVGELNSESVTLSTYYPAPSGVYTNMITTDNTYLARDGGRVGVGTKTPGAILDVGVGAAQCCAPAGTVPNLSLAQASNTNGQMSWLQFHNAGESEAYIRLAGGGAGLRAGKRRLEIGDSQGVGTSLTVAGYVKMNAVGCYPSGSVANASICPSTHYATFQPGVYTEGTSYNNLPAPFLIGPPPTYTRIYKFVGINPANGQESAMSFGYTEAIRVACCPKG